MAEAIHAGVHARLAGVTTGDAHPTLEYAQRSKRFRLIRRHRRLLVALALLVAVALIARQSWTPASRYIRWQYWHWQLAHFTMTDGLKTVLVDEAARLESKRPDSEYVFVAASDPDESDVAVFCPRPLQALISIDHHLHRRIDERLSATPVVRFVCQRSRPDGAPRTLVMRWCGFRWDRLVDDDSVVVIAPPSLLEGPNRAPVVGPLDAGFMCGGVINESADSSTLSIDPNDRTQVRLEVIMNASDRRPGRRAVLVGRLTDDDVIRWRLSEYTGPVGGEPYVDERPMGESEAMFEVESIKSMALDPMNVTAATP